MAKPGRTQKQIAERYKDNLDLYKHLNPWRRARLVISLIALVGGILAVCFFYKRTPDEFFNPGPVASPHRDFNQFGFAKNCDGCHDKSLITGGKLTAPKFKEVVKDSFHNGVASSRISQIDFKCEHCHNDVISHHTYKFHEPNVIEGRSCSACHQEHHGAVPMKMVTSEQCASCHNNSAVMIASGQSPGWAPEQRHPVPKQKEVFHLPRPAKGYTKTFSNFWDKDQHPEFQINVERASNPTKVRDPDSYLDDKQQVRDTLRFNHVRHLENGGIPFPDKSGEKLTCNYCHQVEAEGRFMKRVNFDANCRTCHQLQIDKETPDLTLPHGDATAVLGFLRALRTHYTDLDLRKKDARGDVRSLVEKQMQGLRGQFSSDDELIRSVFLTTDPYKPHQGLPSQRKANFVGCAYCHQVKTTRAASATSSSRLAVFLRQNQLIEFAKPVLVDRWMLQSDFHHTKHAGVKCEICHEQVGRSTKSADILMPAKETCATCHRPNLVPRPESWGKLTVGDNKVGKVAAECSTCHKYHGIPDAQTTVATAHGAGSVSVKDMLLGAR